MTSEHSDSVLKLFLGYCVLDLDIRNLRKFPVKIVDILFGTLRNLKSFQFVLHCHRYVVSTEYTWCLKVLNCCNHHIYWVKWKWKWHIRSLCVNKVGISSPFVEQYWDNTVCELDIFLVLWGYFMEDHFLDTLNNFVFPQLEEQKFESVTGWCSTLIFQVGGWTEVTEFIISDFNVPLLSLVEAYTSVIMEPLHKYTC